MRLLTASIAAFALLLGATVLANPLRDSRLGLPTVNAPQDNPTTPAKVELGRRLFFDTLLSSNGKISCASCHDPARALSDGRRVSEGVDAQRTTRNAPSLVNAAFNTSQFWDGRRDSLETQALDPLINPREHGLENHPALLSRISSDPVYVRMFANAFASPAIRAEHVGQALASFERTLIAGDSPFDRYFYRRESTAMSAAAQRGLELFRGAARCADCHRIGDTFALFTDQAFHSLNIGMQQIAPRLDALTTKLVRVRQGGASLDSTVLSGEDLAELGRFAVTLNPADIGKFRTPSLRNVALTGPYMHDGSVATLEEAVDRELYNRGAELGRPIILTPRDKSDLVAFLKALTSPGATSLLTPEPSR